MTLSRDVFLLLQSPDSVVMARINLRERDGRGRTALHLLVENPMNYTLPISESMIPIVGMLLARGADQNLVDYSGRRPVDLVEVWPSDCVPRHDRFTILSMLG